MVRKFISGLFASGPSRRAIIIVVQPPGQQVKYFLTHSDEEMFFLDKRENVATAARHILKRGFKYIHQETDVHTHGYKSFEQDGVEYHLVMFDGPMLPEPGVDGYEKLKAAGFNLVMIGDHSLAPKVRKALG